MRRDAWDLDFARRVYSSMFMIVVLLKGVGYVWS